MQSLISKGPALHTVLRRKLAPLDDLLHHFRERVDLLDRGVDVRRDAEPGVFSLSGNRRGQDAVLVHQVVRQCAGLKALDAKYVEKLKIYVPYIEACEQLSPDDIAVLYSLLNVYSDFGDQAKISRVKKRLKALGDSDCR